jgi:hypothetical protein
MFQLEFPLGNPSILASVTRDDGYFQSISENQTFVTFHGYFRAKRLMKKQVGDSLSTIDL